MMRGINKEMIFRNDNFKAIFKAIFLNKLEECDVEVAAYCIMDNHIHIVLKGNLDEICALLRGTNTAFAMKLNTSMDRVGHVFQGRYKSEEILGDYHLLQVIRYVHNNPVKAGMTSGCGDYHWSSYNEYISGKLEITNKDQATFVIELAGSKNAFQDFHKQYDHEEHLDTKEEMESNRQKKVQKIIEDFCAQYGIQDFGQIMARPELIDLLVKELIEKSKLTLRKISENLGLSKNSVQNIARRYQNMQ
jgi:REP element-mobilizing transposase RayT